MKNKKLISTGIALAMAASLSVPAFGAEIKGFIDVPMGSWNTDAITSMSIGKHKGLLSGTTPPNAQGYATFSPNAEMTCAQFITVATKAMYPDEMKNTAKGEFWWSGAYEVALKNGLIEEPVFTKSMMDKPIERQLMAVVLANACEQLGEKPENLIPQDEIPDYNEIKSYCREDVRYVYSLGLISGMDKMGTFHPTGVLSRAQAASVLYRLVEPDNRKPYDPNETPPSAELGYVTGVQTWLEGAVHTNIPKAGDVVIRADGTKVTLKYGIGNVLGAGQGVDIWSGYTLNGVTLQDGMTCPTISQRPFRKCPKTGEMHAADMWDAISTATNPTGTISNPKNGQIANTWWEYDSVLGGWLWIGPWR